MPRALVRAGATLIVLALAIFIFTNTAYFRVQDVLVEGAKKATPFEVMSLSGISSGMHMFEFNAAKVESAVESHPWVRRARVRREFPGKVIIQVTERSPAATLPYYNGFLVIDDDAHVVDFLASGDIPWPVITGFTPVESVVGDHLSSSLISAGLRCVVALTPAIREKLSEVAVDRNDEITLILMGGMRVLFGQADAQAPRKFKLLESVLEDIVKNKMDVEYVDLRYGNPFVKTKK
jgi:cell division protein FtsQ